VTEFAASAVVVLAPDATRVRRPPPASRVAPHPAGRAPRNQHAVVLASLVGLAFLLRIPTLTRAYWVDEGIAVGISSHRLSQIPGLLRLDGSPPLFYAVLHFWLQAFGASEVSTHTLSLLLSLLIVPIAWWSGRTLFGPLNGQAAGIGAAALAATNPFLNWYSTESRMYPLVCGLAIVAVTLAIRAATARRARDGVLSAVTFAALLYTHNWAIYLLVVTTAVLGARALLRRDWRQAAFVAAAAAGLVVAYLPWLPTFLYQAHHTAAPWAVSPSLGDFFSDPASILGGTLGAVIYPLLAVGLAVTVWLRTAEENMTATLVGGIGALTLIAGWLAAQIEPSWTSRYLAVALGPLLILFGALATSRLGRRVVGLCVVMLVAWSVIGSLLPDTNARYAKSNAAAIASAAGPDLVPGDLVVVTQTEQVAVLAHYLPAGVRFVTPTGVVRDPGVVDWRDLIGRLSRADPCRTVAPELDGLPVGAHVLVVNPLKKLGASGSTWSRTVTTQVAAVDRLIAADRGLAQIGAFTMATKPKPFSAVTAVLFAKREGRTTCP
jgi:mannosyltransferase